jgi:hypothetical protein
LGPDSQLVVHGVGEFFECAFEWQGFPAPPPLQLESIGSLTKRSKAEARIATLVVGAAHDQVAAVGPDRHPGRDVARLEVCLELGHNRRQPRNIGAASRRRHADQCANRQLVTAICTKDFRSDAQLR